MTHVAACSSEDNESAFCKQASTFAATGIRDEHHPIDYLQELQNLVNLAPSDLKEDLVAMLRYEQNYDPAIATEAEIDQINLTGFRVGTEIESRCGVQLPGIR